MISRVPEAFGEVKKLFDVLCGSEMERRLYSECMLEFEE